jgi:poly-gamma-glutamate capsule biosynthesis protein CapA/YwtB (metallophosphatase superfamily)
MALEKIMPERKTLPVLIIAALVAVGSAATRQVSAQIPDGFTVAAAGDLIGPYRSVMHLHDPGLTRVVALVRSADIAFANQEGSIFDLHNFNGAPSAENGGGIPLSPASVAAELRQMGFSLMSKANNHATDWGPEGLAASERSLRTAGIVFAGSGPSQDAARAPAYASTAKGIVALVSTASTYTEMSVAGAPMQAENNELTRPIPGISVLRTDSAIKVTPREFAVLARIEDAYSGERTAEGQTSRASQNGCVRLGKEAFCASDQRGLRYRANAEDEEAVSRSIAEARKRAPLVVFAIHAHESASGDDEADPRPADFLAPLFHKAIDAGADLVIRTGPHTLKGIEIYHGKPILYGLGSLFFDFGGARSYTIPGTEVRIDFTDDWFETAVALITYRGGRVSEIRVYPMLIEVSNKPTCGNPRPATGADARRILERIQRDSVQFGTDLRIANDVGVIHVGLAKQ